MDDRDTQENAQGHDDPSADAIARATQYLAGALTSGEARAFERWVAADPVRQALLADIQAAWSVRHSPAVQGDSDAAWQRAQRYVHASPPRHVARVAAPRVARRLASGLFAPAAAVLIVAGVGLAVRYGLSPAVSGRQYATAAAQHLSVTLADGTQLTLGPASRVRLSTTYGRTTRELELDGEAYVTVKHDAAHPFTVRTANAAITDIGTQFDVRAYRDDPDVRVAVNEGSIGLRPVGAASLPPDAIHGTTLLPGDVATLGPKGVTVDHDADIASLTVWRQGGLSFRDTPLRDVIHDLDRTYDLDVQVADSVLSSRRVTATFDVEPLDEVLGAVAQVVGGQYERTGRVVVIRVRGTTTRRQGPVVRPALSTAQAGRGQ